MWGSGQSPQIVQRFEEGEKGTGNWTQISETSLFFHYFEQLKLLNRMSHPQGLAIVQAALKIQDNTMGGDLQVGGAE